MKISDKRKLKKIRSTGNQRENSDMVCLSSELDSLERVYLCGPISYAPGQSWLQDCQVRLCDTTMAMSLFADFSWPKILILILLFESCDVGHSWCW